MVCNSLHIICGNCGSLLTIDNQNNEKARAKKEMEELRQYHNKCCKENTEKLEQLLEKYNQLSRDFYNGKYCNKENCSLLKAKEKECEELHSRTASIIYSLTGGRLSYSTYTLEGCEDAYRDQLKMDVERATKELEEENDILKGENFTFEELIKTQGCEIDKYKQALKEIENVADDYNRVEKTSQYYREGFDEIQDIINKAKENNEETNYNDNI